MIASSLSLAAGHRPKLTGSAPKWLGADSMLRGWAPPS
jgi:hypothetical protein